jgi:hypothetical protein
MVAPASISTDLLECGSDVVELQKSIEKRKRHISSDEEKFGHSLLYMTLETIFLFYIFWSTSINNINLPIKDVFSEIAVQAHFWYSINACKICISFHIDALHFGSLPLS